MAWPVARENLSFYLSLFSPCPCVGRRATRRTRFVTDFCLSFSQCPLEDPAAPSFPRELLHNKRELPDNRMLRRDLYFRHRCTDHFPVVGNARPFFHSEIFVSPHFRAYAPRAPLIARAESFEAIVGSFPCIYRTHGGGRSVGGGWRRYIS